MDPVDVMGAADMSLTPALRQACCGSAAAPHRACANVALTGPAADGSPDVGASPDSSVMLARGWDQPRGCWGGF